MEQTPAPHNGESWRRGYRRAIGVSEIALTAAGFKLGEYIAQHDLRTAASMVLWVSAAMGAKGIVELITGTKRQLIIIPGIWHV